MNPDMTSIILCSHPQYADVLPGPSGGVDVVCSRKSTQCGGCQGKTQSHVSRIFLVDILISLKMRFAKYVLFAFDASALTGIFQRSFTKFGGTDKSTQSFTAFGHLFPVRLIHRTAIWNSVISVNFSSTVCSLLHHFIATWAFVYWGAGARDTGPRTTNLTAYLNWTFWSKFSGGNGQLDPRSDLSPKLGRSPKIVHGVTDPCTNSTADMPLQAENVFTFIHVLYKDWCKLVPFGLTHTFCWLSILCYFSERPLWCSGRKLSPLVKRVGMVQICPPRAYDSFDILLLCKLSSRILLVYFLCISLFLGFFPCCTMCVFD